MLTSGDLKSGDFLLCTILRNVNTPPPLPTTPPTKLTYDLGHYMKSYMKFCVTVLYICSQDSFRKEYVLSCMSQTFLGQSFDTSKAISYIQFVSWKGYTNLTFFQTVNVY